MTDAPHAALAALLLDTESLTVEDLCALGKMFDEAPANYPDVDIARMIRNELRRLAVLRPFKKRPNPVGALPEREAPKAAWCKSSHEGCGAPVIQGTDFCEEHQGDGTNWQNPGPEREAGADLLSGKAIHAAAQSLSAHNEKHVSQLSLHDVRLALEAAWAASRGGAGGGP